MIKKKKKLYILVNETQLFWGTTTLAEIIIRPCPGKWQHLMWTYELTIGRRVDVDKMIYPSYLHREWRRTNMPAKLSEEAAGQESTERPVKERSASSHSSLFYPYTNKVKTFPIHSSSLSAPSHLTGGRDSLHFSTLLLRCVENWECFKFNGALK